MKILKKSITIPMLAAAMLFGCASDNVDPGNEVNPVEIPASVSSGTTSFAFDFIHALQQSGSAQENFFVSPLSLHMALGMLLNGAEKETADEIQKALKMDAVALADLNAAYKTLINDLPVADSKVGLGLANSIWYKDGFSVENDYLGLLKNSFNADLTGLPFDGAAVNRINQWASDKTNGKIKNVLESISSDQVMFLLNALYFKGDWKAKFDSKNTKDTPFILESGQSKNVKMMFASSDFNIAAGSNFSAVQLPYANGQFVMTLLIPTGKNTIDQVFKGLTLETWNEVTGKMYQSGVTVGLPRFILKYKADLSKTLFDMGIRKVFSAGAELGKINKSGRLFVDYVKQDSYLGIDEKGTEAAAVTTIAVGVTNAGPQEPPRFICDRPFGIVISENTSNTILFMGRINNPESK